jgi:hypothetical protein
MKLLIAAACLALLTAACGDGPTAPSREKIQPVPIVAQ